MSAEDSSFTIAECAVGPNQSLQPTSFSVTPRADARVAPEKAVAEH